MLRWRGVSTASEIISECSKYVESQRVNRVLQLKKALETPHEEQGRYIRRHIAALIRLKDKIEPTFGRIDFETLSRTRLRQKREKLLKLEPKTEQFPLLDPMKIARLFGTDNVEWRRSNGPETVQILKCRDIIWM